MKQRLGIAHALLGDPSVLILDEPANGLDPAGIRWMRGLLKGYAERGGTVLLSSHLLNEVELIADEMILIGHGKIVAQGDKKSLLARTPTVELARHRARQRSGSPRPSSQGLHGRRRGRRPPGRAAPVEVGRVAARAPDRAHRPARRRGRASRTCSSSSPPTPSATYSRRSHRMSTTAVGPSPIDSRPRSPVPCPAWPRSSSARPGHPGRPLAADHRRAGPAS